MKSLRPTNRRAFIRANEIFPLIMIVGCLSFAIFYQTKRFEGVKQQWDRFYQTMKLPPVEFVELFTLGYDNIYANWLWLQSIQAFGKGWITDTMQKRIDLEGYIKEQGDNLTRAERESLEAELNDLRDRQTEPIYQYFDTLTEIDPKFVAAYRFGNLIIGDNRLDWKRGQQLLRKGTHKNPNNYDIPYLGLYNAIWMTGDKIDARWFARRLQRIPDTPNFMRRLESFIEQRDGRFDVAFEYNIRYLVEYISRGNEMETSIVRGRIGGLLDKWYRDELDQAVDRYLEKYKEHPQLMEDLLEPGIRPDFKAPTPNGFDAALENNSFDIELVDPTKQVPQDLVDRIVEQATRPIVGLPPEPSGTWYLLHPELRRLYLSEGISPNDSRYPYIVSARELLPLDDQKALLAQQFILNFYEENDRVPQEHEMPQFNARDMLGGHFQYDRIAEESPIYGVYYSTAGRRIMEGQEPRLGLWGPGPFPFAIMPRLKDHPSDREWGERMGYILEDGTELWELSNPGGKPEDMVPEYLRPE